MVNTFFVTGTDTDVGKTLVTEALMQAVRDSGLYVAGYKPVASGCELINGQLKNKDALILQEASSVELEYHQHNPYAFAPAIAPHIAAAQVGVIISLDRLSAGLREIKSHEVEWIFVEGAGGWRLPLNDEHYLSDWVKKEQLPVILVVGMRLGCINHALLTLEAIERDGLTIAGWVVNQVYPNMSHYQENVDTLKQRIKAPLLAEIPWLEGEASDSIDQYIDINVLFG